MNTVGDKNRAVAVELLILQAVRWAEQVMGPNMQGGILVSCSLARPHHQFRQSIEEQYWWQFAFVLFGG